MTNKEDLAKMLIDLMTHAPDSLEIGSASKGGTIKVYVDFSDLEAAKTKINNAIAARNHANAGLNQPPQ